MALLLNANDSVSRTYSITKPSPLHPTVPSGCGVRTENLVFTGWAEDFVTRAATDNAYITQVDGRTCLYVFCTVGFQQYDTKYMFKTDFKESTVYTLSFEYMRPSKFTISSTIQVRYTDGTMARLTNYINDGNWHNLTYVTASGKTIKDICVYYSSGWVYINVNTFMVVEGSTAPKSYEPYGYKLPILSNSTITNIYIGDTPLAKDEYVDSTTGKIYRRTKNLSPPEEEWIDGQIWGDGTVHPSTQIKVSPFIDVSTCETCIMEVFSAETEWAAAGYREMAFYDENKQYLGWIGGGGRRALTPNSSENLSEFPAGTVYVRIGCSHSDQPFYPQLVSGYTPTHRFYPYLVPTDPPAPFPQIPTAAGETTISWAGEGLAPSEVELTYKTIKKSYISADDKVYQDPNGQLLGG